MEKNLRFDNKRPWKEALYALAQHSIKWRYFALESDGAGKLVDKSAADYSTVQDKVRNLVNSQIQQLGASTRRQSFTDIDARLVNAQATAINFETSLYDQIISGFRGDSNIQFPDYQQLLNNTPSNASRSNQRRRTALGFYNIMQQRGANKVQAAATALFQMTTIEFWTLASLGVFSNTAAFADLDDHRLGEMAFAFIIGSREFYEALRTTGNQQLFSRHGALAGRGLDLTQLGDRISGAALQVLLNDFMQMGTQPQNGQQGVSLALDDISQQIAPHLQAQLQAALQNALSVYGDVNPPRNSRNNHNNNYTFTLHGHKADVSATQVSDLIRGRIEEVLQTYSAQNSSHPVELVVRNSSGQVYFRVNVGVQRGALYDAKLDFINSPEVQDAIASGNYSSFVALLNDNQDARIGLVQAMYTALVAAIRNLRGTPVLNVGGLGQLDIGQLVGRANISHFYDCAMTAGGPRMRGALTRNPDIRNAWRSFSAGNSNAWVSGFLGELRGLYSIRHFTGRRGYMSGSVWDTANTSSVNDLRFGGTRDTNRFGVNVKHYISSNTNTIGLYKDSARLELFGNENGHDYLRTKYLGNDYYQLLAFLTANAGYISGRTQRATLERVAENIAYRNIDSFYRIADFNSRYRNRFFLVNNVVYPLSYIYGLIRNQFQLEHQGGFQGDKLIEVTVTGQPIIPTYPDLIDAIVLWRTQDWDIRQYARNNTPNNMPRVAFRPRGLRFNLARLSLA